MPGAGRVCGDDLPPPPAPEPGPPRPRPTPARALSEQEREALLELLHCERFVDCSPAQVYATLLEEGHYLAAERTMYRLLAARHVGVWERRDQLTHPAYAKPELLAERPNELWSWDISKLVGPANGQAKQLHAARARVLEAAYQRNPNGSSAGHPLHPSCRPPRGSTSPTQRRSLTKLEFHAECLRPVAETLLRSGIRFGIKFIGTPSLRRPDRHEFIHTLPGALTLGARIGTPNVGLLMDTWHLFTSGGTPADMRSLRSEQVVHAHVNDAPVGVALEELIDTERLLSGASGVIDARAFLTVLDEIGFDGPTLVEPFNAEVRALAPEERVAAVAASLESVWP